MFKIGYRTLKTALGTALAIYLAQLLHLQNFASAGIITILCIQITQKRSLQASWADLPPVYWRSSFHMSFSG